MKASTIYSAAAILAVAVTGSALAADPIKFDYATPFAPDTADGMAATRFAELVKEKTNGEIEITIHYSGSLGYGCEKHLELVESGALPMATICGDQLTASEPLFGVNTLPFITTRVADIRTLRESAMPFLTKKYESYNQRPLYTHSNTPAGVWAKKPITGLADMANVKIRVWNSMGLEVFTNAGAAAVAMPWGEVVPALNTGVIEGVATAADAGFRTHFNDYLDHFMALNFAVGVGEATINLDVWNELSPEHQKAIDEAARETTDFAFQRMEGLIADTFAEMRAAGMTVIEEFSPEFVDQLRTAAEPVTAKWLVDMGADGQAILDTFKQKTGG